MSEDKPADTPEPGPIPDAPAAHGPSGSPPTPPPWTYRAGGEPAPAATERQPGGQRPTGAPALPGPVRSVSSSLGPPGRERSLLAVVVLSVLTLGVYTLRWH